MQAYYCYAFTCHQLHKVGRKSLKLFRFWKTLYRETFKGFVIFVGLLLGKLIYKNESERY